MSHPLVSIIIPTYNRAEFVHKALESALNQTYTNIEVIIVDDCSPDNTSEVIKKYQQEDKRIKYIRNKKNSGPCFTRNQGLKVAQGDYVQFLDDDDTIAPKKIEKQVDKFQHITDTVGIVSCDIQYNRSDISTIKTNRLQGNIYKKLLKSYCLKATHSMLIKKEALKNISFDESLPSGQEYDLQLQICKDREVDYVPEVLCNVYESKNQISFNFKKKIQGNIGLVRKWYPEFIKQKVLLYNTCRFGYLIFLYTCGYIFGKKFYLFLPK